MVKRNLRKDENAQGLMCLAMFAIMFIGGGVMVAWLTTQLVNIGIGLMLICIPIVLIIVCAIVAKRYLFGKGGKK